jgi:hypothetical protein
MSLPPIMTVRRRYSSAVLANRVRPADRWGQPCSAYNVCVLPDRPAATAFATVGAGLSEPALLPVPAAAIHANLAWLLPVHEDFDVPKDELWRRHGDRWLAVLDRTAARTAGFRLRFRQLAATDSAVITVADEPNPFSALRATLSPLLGTPGRSSAGNLAHITLFRYAGALHDPAALVDRVAAIEFDIEVHVRELLVIRERVFPSLDYDIVRRVPLIG